MSHFGKNDEDMQKASKCIRKQQKASKSNEENTSEKASKAMRET